MRYEAKTEAEAVEPAARELGTTAARDPVPRRPRREVVLGRPDGRDRGARARSRDSRRRSEPATSREPEPDRERNRSPRPSRRRGRRGEAPAAPGASGLARGGRARRVDAVGASVGGRVSRRDAPARRPRRRDGVRAHRRRRRAAPREQGGGPERSGGPDGAHREPPPRPSRATRGSTPRGSARTSKESLEELAQRSADEAKRTRRPQLLPPLSPSERRLVHLALADDPEVETESEGDGFLKRVAVRAQGALETRAPPMRAPPTRLSRDDRGARDPAGPLCDRARSDSLGRPRHRGASCARARAGACPRPRARAAAAVPRLRLIADGRRRAIDRGLVTFFAAPASFTGEDVAEISVHGSPVVVERLLAAALAAGARAARPGEFTERAFRLGKLDLVRAEAIRDLIDSRTEAAARASARRLEGALSARLAGMREDLLAAAASLAATIDFSEDVGRGGRSRRRGAPARPRASARAARGELRDGPAPARERLPGRDPRPAQRRQVDALQRARRAARARS